MLFSTKTTTHVENAKENFHEEHERRPHRDPLRTGWGYYANANQSRPPQNNYRPNRLDWQNITFDSYADANDVLNEMGHALHEYGQVTIADFYDVVGITRDARDYQDCKYGWYDLGPASIKGVPGGYTIVFPKPVPLN